MERICCCGNERGGGGGGVGGPRKVGLLKCLKLINKWCVNYTCAGWQGGH